MVKDVFLGIMIPFFGTAAGAACVFFMKRTARGGIERVLLGFAGGVMVAASVWSLILPAIEGSAYMGKAAFVPAAAGLWLGALFIRGAEYLSGRFDRAARSDPANRLKLLVLAIVIHNVPEGMAVGIIFAAWAAGAPGSSLAGAMALSVGIAIQNLPEGAIVSFPIRARGEGRAKSFFYGALSGAVEPVGAVAAFAASAFFLPLMSYFLSFAAGAMLFVVADEIIPESAAGAHGKNAVVAFLAGFTLMMILDVALG